MKFYSIFDDYGEEPIGILQNAGIEVVVHPLGIPRPSSAQMKEILSQYDGVIIGTSQQISEDMFESVDKPCIIATASVGTDHIHVPIEKKRVVTIYNTPKANAQSVAEYTIGVALACCKRIIEGKALYQKSKSNKELYRKPEDLAGKVMGVVGAGNVSKRIMEYAIFFGMRVICWTEHPQNHSELLEMGITFTTLCELFQSADVISVNIPNTTETKGLVSAKLLNLVKESAIFISVSRIEVIDYKALFQRTIDNRSFYVCLDIDVKDTVAKEMPDLPNVIVTPHIAGGTIETRKRMFRELAEQIAADTK